MSKMHSIPLLALLQYDMLPYYALFIVVYILFVNSVRFQRMQSLHRRYSQYATRESLSTMTAHDAWAIQKEFLQLEFPFIALKSLQFALFRTYGIPSISSILTKTSQFTCPGTSLKRYADTTTLIGEFMAFPPSSDRARTALARTNILHSGYRAHGSIREEDMLYTLSLFATEPIRFIERFEWRSLTDLEKCAIGTYWQNVGEALGISYEGLLAPTIQDKEKGERQGFENGLHWLQAVEAWGNDYEKREMRPFEANKVVADQTTNLILYGLPAIFRPAAVSFVSFMMDERLRWAMMYEPPSSFASRVFASLIDFRKLVLRYLTPPRPYFLRFDVFSETPDPNTGRHFVHIWSAAPYYVRPTLWNRWGPGAWVRWSMGLPVPGDQGDAYSPQGYYTPDLGPKYFVGKGYDRMKEIKERLGRQC